MNCGDFNFNFQHAFSFRSVTLLVYHIFRNHFCSPFKIKHMMAFIEQEAKEKAEEIEAKVCKYKNSISVLFKSLA